MIAVRDSSGRLHVGRDARSIVRSLREHSLLPGYTTGQFMYLVAGRTREYTGKQVRTSSAREFIEDLLAGGFLVEENIEP